MNDVKMTISVDSEKAEKNLDAIAKKSQQTKQAAEQAVGGGNGGGGSGPSPKGIANEMADVFGKRAGTALAKFIGGFIIDQGIATAFNLSRKVGEDHSKSERAESTLRGAIQMGTAGAAFGPWGAALGALLGGINAFVNKTKEIQDRIDQSRLDYSQQRADQRRNEKRDQETLVFDFQMGLMNQEEQIKAIEKRRQTLQGNGVSSDHYWDDLEKKYSKAKNEKSRYEMMSGNLADKDILDDFDQKIFMAKTVRDQFKDAAEAALKALREGKDLPSTRLGRNKAGTTQYYEILKSYAEVEKGPDSKDLDNVNKELSAVNNLRDPLATRALGIKLDQINMLGRLADRQAVTDQLSSKGMGVGAQVSASSASEKLINVAERILKEIRTSGKSAFEVIHGRDVFGAVFQ